MRARGEGHGYSPAVGDMTTIASIVLGQQQVLVTFGVGCLLLVPSSALLGRRAGWSWWRVLAAAMTAFGTALILAVTLGRYENGIGVGWQGGCLLQPGLSLRSPEEQLNFLLFAPACFFGVLALRRYAPVLALAVLVSGLVETVQSVTGVGTCQTSDIVRNVGGGALAGLVALMVVVAWQHGRPDDPVGAG